MDITEMIEGSIFTFDGPGIGSIAELKTQAENLYVQSKKLIDSNKKIPITFYLYTPTGHTMRLVPNFPKQFIATVLAQACQSGPGVTAIIAVTEAWGLYSGDGDDDQVQLGSDEMREWLASGQSVSEHPDARDILVITSLCNIGGHGGWTSMGQAPVDENGLDRSCGEIKWMHDIEAEGTLIPPIEDILSVMEDAEYLREKQRAPKPGEFSGAANGW